jgi:exosortase/archaeosortase family protein
MSAAAAPLPEPRTGAVLVAAYLVAAWPVWGWYIDRLGDGGDEPLGLVPLALAAGAVVRAGRGEPWAPGRIIGLAACGLLAVLTVLGAPPLIRALAALGALAAILPGALGWRLGPGTIALGALSLPIVASLQFWAGGPLRTVAAQVAQGLTTLAGTPVTREGVVLLVAGQPVLVDGPCSGIRLLWTAAVAAAAVAAWSGWGWRRTIAALALAALAAVLANGWRAATLTLAAHGTLPEAPWLHTATGLCALVAALAACHRLLLVRTTA